MHIHLVNNANTLEYRGSDLHLQIGDDGKMLIKENITRLIINWQVSMTKVTAFSLSGPMLTLTAQDNSFITIPEKCSLYAAKKGLLK